MKAEVAAWALDQGAAIANDVWGLQRDPAMAALVAERGVPIVIMHNRDAADPALDIMADITAFFDRSLEIAARAGIARENIVLDPGIGFGKTPEQSITALARLGDSNPSACRSWSAPRASASSTRSRRRRRTSGSAARSLRTFLRWRNGAAIVRTHDVAETVQALRVAAAIRGAPMSDTIFVTGLVIHAHHGVMEHEAGRSALRARSRTRDRTRRRRGERQARRHGLLFRHRRDRDRAFTAQSYKLVEAAAGAVADAILAAFPRIVSVARDRAQAAGADRRDLRRCRRYAAARAPASRWHRRSSPSAAMSATRARRLTARSPRSATATKYASARARPTIARPPGASRTSQRSSTSASRSRPTSRRTHCSRTADGRARLRPRPQPRSGAGVRVRSISISSPMTI